MIGIWMALTALCCLGTLCFNIYILQRDNADLENQAKQAENAPNQQPKPFNQTNQAAWYPNMPGPAGPPDARNQDPFYRSTFGSSYNQPYPGTQNWGQSNTYQPGEFGNFQNEYPQYPPQYPQDYSQPFPQNQDREYSQHWQQPPQDYPQQPPLDYPQPPQDYPQQFDYPQADYQDYQGPPPEPSARFY